MVSVAGLAATDAGVPTATISSTGSATSSAARPGYRSAFASGATRQQSNTPAVLRVNVALVSPIWTPAIRCCSYMGFDVGLATHVCHPPFTSSGFAISGGGGLPLSFRVWPPSGLAGFLTGLLREALSPQTLGLFVDGPRL